MDVRLFDANALLKKLDDLCKSCENYDGILCDDCDLADAISYVEDAPTIDAQPVKQGHWSECWRDPARNVISVICSACEGASLTYLPKKDLAVEDVPNNIRILMPYCPKCGARMEVDENEQAK